MSASNITGMEENSGSAEKKANRDIAEVAIEAAYRKLQSEDSLAWVNESGLKLRAFLWGIYAAVEPFADEQQLNGLILRVARDTLFQRDGDRPIEAAFEKSSTGKALKQLEGVCADSASSLQQIEQAIEAMRQAVSTERNFSMMIFDSISERLTHLRRESARQTPEMDPRTAAALACQRRMTMLKELREPLLACCALSKRSGVE